MHWVSIIFIGLASNIDNLGIGVAFGTRSTRIPILANLFIAILGMAATYSSITIGHLISGFMNPQYADVIGGLIIMAIGARSMIQGINSAKRSSLPVPDGHMKEIALKESIPLGFALSINCFSTGIGAGVSGVPPILTAISVGIFSVLSIIIGMRIGHQVAKTWLAKYSTLISGLILIAIGLYEIIV